MDDTNLQQHNTDATQPSPASPNVTDIRVIAIQELDSQSAELQSKGMLMEALQCMERSLILRGSVYGLESQIVYDACITVCSMCNYLAMLYLSHTATIADESPCLTLLNKAEVLSEHNTVMKCITYNNYSCYYRKHHKLRIALKYAEKCIELENKLTMQQFNTSSTIQSQSPYSVQPVSSADTHLNICTILSELKRYSDALTHGKLALKLLLIELFGDDNMSSTQLEQLNETKADSNDGIASADQSSVSPHELPSDRVGVLSIAYHNQAVQQEQLHQYIDALQSYTKAYTVSKTYLGTEHALCKQMYASLRQYTAKYKSSSKLVPHQHKTQMKQSLVSSQNKYKNIPNLAKTITQLNNSLSNTSLIG